MKSFFSYFFPPKEDKREDKIVIKDKDENISNFIDGEEVTNIEEIKRNDHHGKDGGFGDVSKKEMDGKNVAVKLMKWYSNELDKFDKIFNDESLILETFTRELDCPFFTKLISCEKYEQSKYSEIIMEYCEPIAYVRCRDFPDDVNGFVVQINDISDLFSRNNCDRLDIVSIKSIFKQILAFLIIVQNKYPGFRHNDFHAGNIILIKWTHDVSRTINVPEIGEITFDGDYLVKICDFGLSGSIDESSVLPIIDTHANAIKLQIYDFYYLAVDISRHSCTYKNKSWIVLVDNFKKMFGELLDAKDSNGQMHMGCREWHGSQKLCNLELSDALIKAHEKTQLSDLWKILDKMPII
jgi:serine/threonine protein kinase